MPSSLVSNPIDPKQPLFGPRPGGWSILGPGGGGCVHLLTVNPHRPDTFLVSCDMTAAYITHDGGESWRSFNLKSRLHAFAFDPASPDVIYAGSSGLFRSEDNGLTWRLLFPDPATVTGETRLRDEGRHTYLSADNWPGGIVCAIHVDAEQPGRVLIAVKQDGLLVFESCDRGRTWAALPAVPGEELHLLSGEATGAGLVAFSDAGCLRLPQGAGAWVARPLPAELRAVRSAAWGVVPGSGKPGSGPVFYITAVEILPSGELTTSVWRAGPALEGWTRCAAGLDPLAQDGSRLPCAFSQVSTCRADARTVWVIAEQFKEWSAGRTLARHGILKTTDAGESWDWAVKMDDFTDPPNREWGWAERDYGAQWGDLTGDGQISPKGRFAWDVIASPVDPQVCYTMDFSTIYETRDGGATWRQRVTRLNPDSSAVSRGIDVLSAYNVVFDPFDPQHIVLPVTDAGIFHSLDRGQTWLHSLEGVPRAWINTCYWLVFDPALPGKAWSAWSAMHDLPRSKMFQDEFFARDEGGVCLTEDGLRSWKPVAHGLPAHTIATHLVLDPHSPPGRRTLYLAAMMGGVYRSVDAGHTWEGISGGLGERPAAWRLALLPGGDLYVVTVFDHTPGKERGGALHRWQPTERRWENVPLPPGVADPNDLTFDRHGRLYLACWPVDTNDGPRHGGAYASDDGGCTWEPVFDDTARAYTVTVDPANPARLYLATFDAALYLSDDRGMTWRRLPGYDFQWCHRPVPDPQDPNKLYIATFGNSVWHGQGGPV